MSMNEVRLRVSETYQNEEISIPRGFSMWYLSPSKWRRASTWGRIESLAYNRLDM